MHVCWQEQQKIIKKATLMKELVYFGTSVDA